MGKNCGMPPIEGETFVCTKCGATSNDKKKLCKAIVSGKEELNDLKKDNEKDVKIKKEKSVKKEKKDKKKKLKKLKKKYKKKEKKKKKK